MRDITEIAPKGPLDAEVTLPGSKSITHRALFCAALAEGTSGLSNALLCIDTHVSAMCLNTLGARIKADERDSSFLVRGMSGVLREKGGWLGVGECGTALRFLTALLTLGCGEFRLDCGEVKRPIGDLADALNRSGCRIEYEQKEGYPPVCIHADGFPGGSITVSGNVSSQFASALLLVSPYAHSDTEITLTGGVASAPYIELTVEVMRAFGVDVSVAGNTYYVPAGRGYGSAAFHVEGDASAATYFMAAAAICGGRVRANGAGKDSQQGDIRFAQLLAQMGCRVSEAAHHIEVEGPITSGIEADMRDMPDAVPTLAAVACFAEGPTKITGVENLRLKESDRISALADVLGGLGAEVKTSDDAVEITPSKMRGGVVDPHGDHRIVMSAALVGLRIPGVAVRGAGCVAKSFPDFFAELKNLTERSKN